MGARGPAVSAHRRLLEAVLDLDPVYPRLYQTSAEFHATIDTLRRVLGPLVRLIADDALRADQARSHAESLLREGLQRMPLQCRCDRLAGLTNVECPVHGTLPKWQEEARGPAPGWKPEPRQ